MRVKQTKEERFKNKITHYLSTLNSSYGKTEENRCLCISFHLKLCKWSCMTFYGLRTFPLNRVELHCSYHTVLLNKILLNQTRWTFPFPLYNNTPSILELILQLQKWTNITKSDTVYHSIPFSISSSLNSYDYNLLGYDAAWPWEPCSSRLLVLVVPKHR